MPVVIGWGLGKGINKMVDYVQPEPPPLSLTKPPETFVWATCSLYGVHYQQTKPETVTSVIPPIGLNADDYFSGRDE